MAKPTAKPPGAWIPTRGRVAKIMLWYVGLNTVWILSFSWLLERFVHNHATEDFWELANGFLAVLLTAVFLGLALDRSAREIRRSTEKLEENEARLRVVGDNLPDSYVYEYVHDETGKPCFTYVSAGVMQVHGVGVAEVLRDAGSILGQMDPAQMPAHVATVAESGRALTQFRMELRIKRADGERRVILIQSQPRRNQAGGLVWDGLVTDITETKQAELALQQSEERFRRLVETAPEAIFIRTKDSFSYLNAAAARLFGVDGPEVLLGQPVLERFPPECREEIRERMRRLDEFGQPTVSDERIILRQDDSQVNTIISAVPFFYRDRQSVLVFARDITERKRAEAALEESERFAMNTLDSLSAHIAILDRAGTILAINRAWRRFWEENAGAGVTGVVGANYLAVCDAAVGAEAENARTFAAGMRSVLLGHEPEFSMEYPCHSATEERWFLGRVTRFIGDEPLRLVVEHENITRRKRVEDALRDSEAQFRAMFETASVGVAQSDPFTARLVRVNRKMSRITGYSAEELLQMTVEELVHPDDWPADQERRQRLMAGQAPEYRMEKRYLRKDGRHVWVSVNMTLIRDATGRPFRTVATVEEITERRKAEEERLRLSTALEQTAESIVITDLAGMILYVNPAFERISGYSRQEVIGHAPGLLKSGKQDAAFYQQLWATISRGDVWRGHFINKRKDGSIFEEEATISPVRNASGNVDHYMAIKLDVTREMALESQFRQAQKLEAIGQLAGGVAHDFNNILTSILLQVELSSMEENLTADLRDSFQQIRSDAERAASLTRQLLLFSRRQIMQSQDLDLNGVVTNLTKMLQRIIGEDVRLHLNLHPKPLMVHADAGMLDQVVMNLAGNARDAMPGGGRLAIETSEKIVDEAYAASHSEASPGRYVCLSVSDTGTGIPADVLPRIFEPFFTTKEPGKGTGLGLATVFGIVKQHRGWLTVESEVGRGTTFRVYIPAISIATKLAVAGSRPKPCGGTETILLTEDDAIVRMSFRKILAQKGYQVLEAANGQEALKVWAEHGASVALLLTDLVMPAGLNGRELARQIKTNKPDLKVVYISGYSAEIAGKEINLGPGEAFIQKPLGSDELLKTVRSCLDG